MRLSAKQWAAAAGTPENDAGHGFKRFQRKNVANAESFTKKRLTGISGMAFPRKLKCCLIPTDFGKGLGSFATRFKKINKLEDNAMINTICHMNNPCNGFYGKCLDVKITNACNGKCGFCIEKYGYRPGGVSVYRLIEATNALEDYQTVLILGGEPFLYPELDKYLEGIKDKKEIYITTNGSRFASWSMDMIASYLTAVNISMHYYSQAGNAAVVGTDVDFIDIYKAIKEFKNAGVKVRVNANLIDGYLDNKTDVQLMISAAKNLGVDEIRFAELQNCTNQYVSAAGLFDDFPDDGDDPFSQGCERLIYADANFKVWLRLACGLVNPNRTAPVCPVRKGSQTKVLYPDGTVSDGWKQAAGTRRKTSHTDWSCHNSCH